MIGVSQIHMYKPAQGWRKRKIMMTQPKEPEQEAPHIGHDCAPYLPDTMNMFINNQYQSSKLR